jgi:hypothetical protein
MSLNHTERVRHIRNGIAPRAVFLKVWSTAYHMACSIIQSI